VVKLADARDSKSRFLREVWVRLPPPAPSIQHVKTTGFLNVEWALRIGVLSAEKWRVRRLVRQGMANRLGRLESPGAVRGMGVRSRPCIRKSTFRLDLPQRFCHTSADCPRSAARSESRHPEAVRKLHFLFRQRGGRALVYNGLSSAPTPSLVAERLPSRSADADHPTRGAILA
jgi:hypothetical protein